MVALLNPKKLLIMLKEFLTKLNLQRFAILFLITIVIGCSKDESPSTSGNLSISAKSTFSNASGKSFTGKSVNNDLIVTDFRLNLKEFELEFDVEEPGDDYQGDENDQWDDDGYYDFQDEIELEGPFELDLLAPQVNFIDVSMPMANFEELEFKFDASNKDTSSDMFEKSVLIQGTYQGTPFIFWHNFDDEVEVDFEDPAFDIAISTTPEGIVIDFDLSLIFDATAGVDLSQAADGNADGTIEISPSDPDGNNELAQSIRDAIKASIDLLDD